MELSKENMKSIDVLISDFVIRIFSNIETSRIEKYFSKKIVVNKKLTFPRYYIYCMYCEKDEDIFIHSKQLVDNTYRGKCFSNGYYVTDHFGDPVNVITSGNEIYLYGKYLEKIIWSYFIKYFLLLDSIDNKGLFIKAASFAINNKATLLIGKGGAGKTVFLSHMCMNKKVEFITNSNAIIKNNHIHGIYSSMRIRPGKHYNELFKVSSKHENLKEDEVIIDPDNYFEITMNTGKSVKNILILKYTPNVHKVTKISKSICVNYLELYALGINVYKLEEDLQEYFLDNVLVLGEAYSNMKAVLNKLVGNCNCYYIETDILESANKEKIEKLLL